MNPLIAIAARVFPDIIRSLADDKQNRVQRAVLAAVTAAAGNDPAAAEQRIQADPQVALQLQTDLARIAIEEQRLRNEAELEHQRLANQAEAERLKATTQSSENATAAALRRNELDATDRANARAQQ